MEDQELAQILNNKTQVESYDNFRLIYFLFLGDSVVYVGQSCQGLVRLHQHRTENTKKFDSFSFILANPSESLNDLEAHYIVKFRPVYNKKVPPNSRYKTLKDIRRAFNANYYALRRAVINYNVKPVYLDLYDKEHFYVSHYKRSCEND